MSGWLSVSELPDEKPGARYLMILDGVEQECHECTEPEDRKRWFYGTENGAYPIDEIELFNPIVSPTTWRRPWAHFEQNNGITTSSCLRR